MDKLNWQDIENIRGRVGCAFKTLRSQGFIARQRFLCCGGCAGAQIATDFGAMKPGRQAKVKGAVFFHRQDSDRLDDGGPLFVRFGAIDADCKCRDNGEAHRVETQLATVDVGRAVVAALEAEQLTVEWDGDPANCIKVIGIPAAEIPMAVGL